MDPEVSVQEIDRLLGEVDTLALEASKSALWDEVIRRVELIWDGQVSCSIWSKCSDHNWTCLAWRGTQVDELGFLAGPFESHRDYWVSSDRRAFAITLLSHGLGATRLVVRFSDSILSEGTGDTIRILLAFAEILRAREHSDLEHFLGEDLQAFLKTLRVAWNLPDKQEAAYQIVNQLSLILSSDRVFLIQELSHNRSQVLAVSGISSPEPTAAELEFGIRLGRKSLATQEFQSASKSQDRQLETRLSEGQGNLEFVVAIPLTTEASCQSAIVAEWVESTGYIETQSRFQLISRLLAVEWTAINCWLSVPFWIRERAIEKTGSSNATKSTRKRRLVGCLLALVVACLFLSIPYPLTIDVYGSLQAEKRRAVFAPTDCEVAEVYVHDGQVVAAGQALLSLNSPYLNIEIEELQGEIRANQAKRDILEISVNQIEEADDGGPVLAGQLASEIKQLETLCDSANKKLAALLTERQKLAVSAAIQGTIVAEELKKSLMRDRCGKGTYS